LIARAYLVCNGLELPEEKEGARQRKQIYMTEEEFNKSLEGKPTLHEWRLAYEAEQKEIEAATREDIMKKIEDARKTYGFA